MNAAQAGNGATILIVDDERGIRRLLRVALENAGYQVAESENATQALSHCATNPPEALILDLGLPDMEGAELVRRLREWTQVPVMILSVRHADGDKVAALDAGADDYLSKPFSTAELLARLRALLRRTQAGPEPAIVRVGNWEIDLSQRAVRRDGEEVHLTTKEYGMIRLLARYPGRVVTHRQMLREVWGPNAESSTHYLRVHMTHLRQKLEDDPSRPSHLKTEPGVGFRLV